MQRFLALLMVSGCPKTHRATETVVSTPKVFHSDTDYTWSVDGDLVIDSQIALHRSAIAARGASSLDAPSLIVEALGGTMRVTSHSDLVTDGGLDAEPQDVPPTGSFEGARGGFGGSITLRAKTVIMEACGSERATITLGSGGKGATLFPTRGDWPRTTLTAGTGGGAGGLRIVADTVQFSTCRSDDSIWLNEGRGGAGGAIFWDVADGQTWGAREITLQAGHGGHGIVAGGRGGDVSYLSGKAVTDGPGPSVTASAGYGGNGTLPNEYGWEALRYSATAIVGGDGGDVIVQGNNGASGLPNKRDGGRGGDVHAKAGGYGTVSAHPQGANGVLGRVIVAYAGHGGDGYNGCGDADASGGVGGDGGTLTLNANDATLDIGGTRVAVGGRGGNGDSAGVAGQEGTITVVSGQGVGEPERLPPSAHGVACSQVAPSGATGGGGGGGGGGVQPIGYNMTRRQRTVFPTGSYDDYTTTSFTPTDLSATGQFTTIKEEGRFYVDTQELVVRTITSTCSQAAGCTRTYSDSAQVDRYAYPGNVRIPEWSCPLSTTQPPIMYCNGPAVSTTYQGGNTYNWSCTVTGDIPSSEAATPGPNCSCTNTTGSWEPHCTLGN